MNKTYPGDPAELQTDESLRDFFVSFVLPEFGVNSDIEWERHVHIGPDNLLHSLKHNSKRYVLAFDDYYPAGFSLEQVDSLRPVRLINKSELLHVSASGSYRENVTGAFRLYEILESTAFDQHVESLVEDYGNWSKDETDTLATAGGKVDLVRDILTIARSAELNKNDSILQALRNIVSTLHFYDIEDKTVPTETLLRYIESLSDKVALGDMHKDEDLHHLEHLEYLVFKDLAVQTQRQIDSKKYDAEHLEVTVRFVSAMYAKTDGDNVQGASVALVFKNEQLTLYNDHFLSKEIKQYFDDNPYVTQYTVEHHMPDTLGGYRLVRGSVDVADVFERELEFLLI